MPCRAGTRIGWKGNLLGGKLPNRKRSTETPQIFRLEVRRKRGERESDRNASPGATRAVTHTDMGNVRKDRDQAKSVGRTPMRKPLPKNRVADMRRTVAANLAWHRTARGLSQEALAKASGMHRTYVSLVERAIVDPTVGSLYRLAWALRISPARLLRSGKPFTPKKRGRQAKPR